MDINDLTYQIIGSIYDVYNNLGPGLLESVYEEVLVYELRKKGLQAEHQINLPIIYDGHELKNPYQLDIIVNNQVIIELKSVEELNKLHFKQLQTYLKLSSIKHGLLVNFNTTDIKANIRRVVM